MKIKKLFIIILLVVAFFGAMFFLMPFLFFTTVIFSGVYSEITCNQDYIIDNPLYKTDSNSASDYYRRKSRFARKGSNIYLVKQGGFDENHCIKIKHADTDTFQVLSEIYAKDKNNAYVELGYLNLKDEPELYTIFNIDSPTFRVLSNIYKYAQDKNHVYKALKIMEDIDQKTFEVSNDSRGWFQYAKDKNRTYEVSPNYHYPISQNKDMEHEGVEYQGVDQEKLNIEQIISTTIDMVSSAKKCDEAGKIIRNSGTTEPPRFMCDGVSDKWPILSVCGNVNDTQWIVAYNNNNWEYTIECNKYPECSGIENVRCTKDGCVFSEKCNN